jgi:Na+/H+-translocating membrane pyrophosphatase
VLVDDHTSTLSEHGIKVICDLSSFQVIVGLLIGSILPNLFASLAMQAVGRASGQVVQEVRRQFREMQGIMQGTQRADYGRCVDIVTHQLHDATHAGGARRRHVAPAGQAPVSVTITGTVKCSAANCLRSS